MQELKRLPVGEDNFRRVRQKNCYYVDKTRLIEKILNNGGSVNLFTRPRRFGKSLNMSMLKCFFEMDCDERLFDGLYIKENKALCEKYMGKYPVISISLKSVEARNFEEAKALLVKIINEEARRFQFLLQSEKLTDIDKKVFKGLLEPGMKESVLVYSIRELTELLRKHYGREVIVLIDEYDVPLAKANEKGYYDEMTDLIRNFFGNALKTNDNLYFAVLTGCLRVAKESIFTGMNNFKVYSLTDVAFDECFGFTDLDVKELLKYYGQMDHYGTIKEWYDGYQFGNVEVYCPWDVICYCQDHIENPEREAENYWLNTSGNEIIKRFIETMGTRQQPTKTELEDLINGGCVQKEISQEMTYKELYDTPNNIWSALLMTGYLTQRGKAEGKRYNLAIPNLEVRNIMTDHILKLFQETIEYDDASLGKFCTALEKGKMEKECEKALRQIDEKNYTEELEDSGVHKILKYAITCNRKKCKVLLGE